MLLQVPVEEASHSNEVLDLEPRYTRRLSDKMTVAFYAACKVGNLKAAAHLLAALECEVVRSKRLGRNMRADGDDLAAVRARMQLELRTHDEEASKQRMGGVPRSAPY